MAPATWANRATSEQAGYAAFTTRVWRSCMRISNGAVVATSSAICVNRNPASAANAFTAFTSPSVLDTPSNS